MFSFVLIYDDIVKNIEETINVCVNPFLLNSYDFVFLCIFI